MTRDYSQFLPPSKRAATPVEPTALEKLGWRPFFAQQLSLEELEQTPPARVVEVHRTGMHVLGDGVDEFVPAGVEATVGDWLLYDAQTPAESRVLERSSLIERRAPGTERRRQAIAANLDTIFIVSSCNKDFNIARLERYVVLAFEAEVTPVILLTKADLCDDPMSLADQARGISERVEVRVVNALSDEPRSVLAPWCRPGQTIAFVGSSGVGKSTLVNALFEDGIAETAAIREGDSKGRHTTTTRHLHFTLTGCGVLDTPGMRELSLTDVEGGIADLFDDLTALAGQCKFRDCMHESEPNCAVQAAIKDGTVDPVRMARWQKLAAEDKFNSTTLSERKAGDKSLRKLIRTIQKDKRK